MRGGGGVNISGWCHREGRLISGDKRLDTENNRGFLSAAVTYQAARGPPKPALSCGRDGVRRDLY